MNNVGNMPSSLDKDELMRKLTSYLPVLRAKIGVSQGEVSKIIGISRQTYLALETRKRAMSWSTFLSLILFFGCNERTAEMLDSIGVLTPELNDLLSTNNRKEK